MYQEGVSSTLKPAANSKPSPHLLIATLVIVSAIAAVTFTVLYVTTSPSPFESIPSASWKTFLSHRPDHTSHVTVFPPETWEGRHVSWLYKQFMNVKAKPCESFHHYVCGQNSQLDSISMLEKIADNVTSRIREEFLRDSADTSDDVSSSKRKASAFFASCMSSAEDNSKEENRKALVKFMKDEGLSYKEGADFMGVVLRLLIVNNIQTFFALKVDDLPQRGQTNRLIRLVPNLEFERWAIARESYIHKQSYEPLAKEILAATGIAEIEYENLTSAIRQAEDKIMNLRVHKTLTENSTVSQAFGDELETYLRAHSCGILTGSLTLDVNTETARFMIAALLHLSRRELFILLTWEVARQLTNISGLIESDRERAEDFCFGETYAIFKHAVVSPYLLSVVNESKVTEVIHMVNSIVEELEISIRYTYWLGRNLNVNLQNKIRTVKWRLGYAAGLGYWGGVDRYYRNFSVPHGSFLEAYLHCSKAYAQHELNSGTMSCDHSEPFVFINDVLTVDYDAANYLMIAAAAMTTPLFNLFGPPEVNYGALGSLVIRQLMRAFDAENRLDDGSGTRIVWSPREEEDFQSKFSCRHDGTEGRVDPAVSVGAHALYRAYKKVAALSDARLPGMDNLSKDQIFFISRCFLLCGSEQKGRGDGSPPPNQCNILAEDSHEFASAFHCPPGSPMNPNEKCDIW